MLSTILALVAHYWPCGYINICKYLYMIMLNSILLLNRVAGVIQHVFIYPTNSFFYYIYELNKK